MQGGTCMEGCSNIARGIPWREAGNPQSKGCGSAMRVAPIGLFYQDLDDVAEIARSSSLLTHRHPTALQGAAAAAIMVAMALKRAGPEAIFAEIEYRCCTRCADFAAIWLKLPNFISEPPPIVLAKGGLGEGWVAEEAVATHTVCRMTLSGRKAFKNYRKELKKIAGQLGLTDLPAVFAVADICRDDLLFEMDALAVTI